MEETLFTEVEGQVKDPVLTSDFFVELLKDLFSGISLLFTVPGLTIFHLSSPLLSLFHSAVCILSCPDTLLYILANLLTLIIN